MPNFNADAEVYRAAVEHYGAHRPILPSRPIHTGTVAECVRYIMSKHDGYPETYSMRLPLEAGFQTNQLHYRDIEAISKRSDFPRA
jgi:hypothetical protein